MRIYNSLTRQIEEFEPLAEGKAGMYTCGPTVYDYAHIGHARKYVYDDLLRRVLSANGLEVMHVQNVTDVGHLVSDADEGEDKLEKGAREMKRTVWEAAEFFTRDFYKMADSMNILRPTITARATDHIKEQTDLIQKLVQKGFAYETPEAVYFDVGKFPRYGLLFGQKLADKQVAVREEVKTGEHKRHPADFALWFKRVGRFADHQMHWESPWGDGFPGWHIECSAMSMKYLGESFDIHTGGEDHLPVHHPNEIAQAEAATGKLLARYWVHHAFLLIDGQKMSKSLGNYYRVEDVAEKGFDPMALRYLYLTAHYRSPQNFTWSALAAAQTAYDKLNKFVKDSGSNPPAGRAGIQDIRIQLSKEKAKKLDQYRLRFEEAVNNDLQFPRALAVMWEMMKSNIPDYDKADALRDWDEILGLRLGVLKSEEVQIPEQIREMSQKREILRRDGKFVEADELRVEMEKLGWGIEDAAKGSRIVKLKHI